MVGVRIHEQNQMPAALAASLITLLVYLRALTCGFVNLDDPFFVVNNPYIRQLDAELFSWAFSSRTLDLLIPFTWISFAIDYKIWGLNPLGFHLTNVLLHAANTALVAMIAAAVLPAVMPADDRCHAVRRSFLAALLAALLFGIHPLRVESVAWVTERKDVLNGLFTLASVYCYLRYAVKAHEGKGAWLYRASFVLFGCSLLAKPVSVGLPLLFLVLDWHPLRRFGRIGFRSLVGEKLPFFAISIVIGMLTIFLFSKRHLLVGLSGLPLADRFLLSGNALFEYCRMWLFPAGILPFYELPDSMGVGYWIKGGAVLLFTGLCLFQTRKRPWLPVSWFCFLIPVIPVLSFLQNNDVAFAARYTYLPSVVPTIAAACGISMLVGRQAYKVAYLGRILVLFPVILLLAYGATTYRLIGVWQSTESLWTRVIDLNPSTTKYMDRGVYYIINGKPDKAAADFSSAIGWGAMRGKVPDYNAYAFRGVARTDLGEMEGAVLDFDVAIALKPHPTYYYYRAMALQALGRQSEAAKDFERAGPAPPPIDWY